MSDEPKIVHEGPEEVGPLIMKFSAPDENTHAWTFPKASGYFLSEDEYRIFKQMQQWWTTTKP